MIEGSKKGTVTRILSDTSLDRDERARRVMQLVYSQLRATAQKRMRQERADHTLSATALVHEAYLRLMGAEKSGWKNRAHFYFAAANAMRKILIDHARRHGAQKRGRRQAACNISQCLDLADEKNLDHALILDELLLRLKQQDQQAADVVHLRFFAGMSISETARLLRVSEPTVKRNWAYARAWLADALKDQDEQ